jgi:2-polyprenyl-3-methyl-5-hydroxy-6-metoxy-1,4-benzoquinol methylase
MSLMLARQGYTVTAADLSESMLRITRENGRAANLPLEVLRQDIEQMDFRDRSFDTVFAFRLFHHFPNREIRARVVAQLCRVARERVLISYFSPWAGTSLKRALQSKWLGHRQKKFATSRDELESYFAPQGFTLRRTFARCPLLHTLHLALFERK